MSEGSLQAYFKNQCKARGVFWRKIKFEGQRGCPDVMIAYEGRVLFVELKNPNGKGELSALQVRQILKLNAAGVTCHVTDSKDGVDDVIRKLIGT
tara:strand:+ start:2128 stop:2412 length:285 start_codon:yes stop_codon:yes gene_type:complete